MEMPDNPSTGTDANAPDLSHIEYEEEPEFRDPLAESDPEND